MTTFYLLATPVAVSLVSEFVSWLSSKVSKGPLQGQGAFLATAVLSVIGGIAYLAYNQIPSSYLVGLTKYSVIFLGGSTIVFQWIVKTVPGLHFGSGQTSATAQASTVV
jgi:hypothetical protein